jgi:hypothetical protein
MEDLIAALVTATGATLAFDAIGGGKLAGQILQAMEIALSSKTAPYSRYGSSTHKQVYIYGRLSLEPTILTAGYGMAWGVGGFLLTPFLQKVGMEEAGKMRARVAAELKTTFASHYTKTISLQRRARSGDDPCVQPQGDGREIPDQPQRVISEQPAGIAAHAKFSCAAMLPCGRTPPFPEARVCYHGAVRGRRTGHPSPTERKPLISGRKTQWLRD